MEGQYLPLFLTAGSSSRLNLTRSRSGPFEKAIPALMIHVTPTRTRPRFTCRAEPSLACTRHSCELNTPRVNIATRELLGSGCGSGPGIICQDVMLEPFFRVVKMQRYVSGHGDGSDVAHGKRHESCFVNGKRAERTLSAERTRSHGPTAVVSQHDENFSLLYLKWAAYL